MRGRPRPHFRVVQGPLRAGRPAHLEVRAGDLPAARKLLGQAIGRCPKDKLFKSYIQLELQLGEVERCRAMPQVLEEVSAGRAVRCWRAVAGELPG